MLRRVHVQPYDVAHLVHEVGVRRELEGLAPVRLQREGLPDAVDRRRRVPRLAGHRARAPVRRLPRLFLQRLAHHLGHGGVIDAPGTAGPRLVLEPVHAVLGEAVAPLPGGEVVDAERIGDLHVVEPLGGQQQRCVPDRRGCARPSAPRASRCSSLRSAPLSLISTDRRITVPPNRTLPNCTNYENGTLVKKELSSEQLGGHGH